MLIASGFIAGGAVMGVLAALFKFLGKQYDVSAPRVELRELERRSGELLALGAYILLAAYMYWDSRRTDGEA